MIMDNFHSTQMFNSILFKIAIQDNNNFDVDAAVCYSMADANLIDSIVIAPL